MTQRGKRAGFSLIEILVVTFMLGVITLSLIGVFAYGHNLVAKTKQVTLATQVAQLEVERFRNMAFNSIVPGSTTEEFTEADYPVLFRDNEGGQSYLREGERTIAVEDGLTIGLGSDIKRLTVTIEWDYRTRTIANGNPMRKDVVTYITEGGINRK
jgi:type II secretory pathway pseudopilin PulG